MCGVCVRYVCLWYVCCLACVCCVSVSCVGCVHVRVVCEVGCVCVRCVRGARGVRWCTVTCDVWNVFGPSWITALS